MVVLDIKTWLEEVERTWNFLNIWQSMERHFVQFPTTEFHISMYLLTSHVLSSTEVKL